MDGAINTVSEVAVVLIVLMMLGCPLVMGGMMMWRGMRHGKDGEDRNASAS